MECEMQGPTDTSHSSEGCRGQQEPPLGDTARLQSMAEKLVRGYFAEQAVLLAHEEEVATEVQERTPMEIEVQGSTDTSNKEVGGQQGHPLGTAHEEMVGSPAEPQGDAGEQWLHWYGRKRRRQSANTAVGATEASKVEEPTGTLSECGGQQVGPLGGQLPSTPADDAGAQWLHWYAQKRLGQKPQPGHLYGALKSTE